MVRNIAILILLFFIFSKECLSQKDSILEKKFQLSGYLETYYLYDLANPTNHERPSFFYSFNRHNEFNLNLGFIKLAYNHNRVKGNLALMTGSYSRANLSHEPSIYRAILEANISFQLFQNNNIWITTGIFSSHLGFESAVGADCWNLTRSILAENSPYYLSGVKLYSTSKNDKWTLGLTIANGWQRIQRQPGNQLLGVGHQLTYKPNKRVTFNSSSYVGSEFPDTVRQMRYFHDLYTVVDLTKKISFIAGFDIGIEQKSKGSSSYNTWYSPIVITKYKITERLSIAARLEYYSDQDEVIISTLDGNGFSTIGYSLNLDYQLTDQLLFRIEGRSLQNQRNIYQTDNGLSSVNTFFGSSLSLKL